MFVDCKIRFGHAILALMLLVGHSISRAESIDVRPICDSGECTAVLASPELAESRGLCESAALQVSWSNRSNWFLVSCSCNCTEQNNKNWLVRSAGEVIGMERGRYLPKSFFAKDLNPMVPDLMSPHHMCQPVDKEAIRNSAFLLLDKRPSSGDDPYCYDAMYLRPFKNRIVLEVGGRPIASGDREYFYSVDDSVKNQLVALVNRVSEHAQSEAQHNSQERRVVVSSDKAYLYSRPSADAMTKAYLIKGDMVTVHGQLHDVFLKITYVTQRGQTIEKFILCGDVDLCR